MADAPGLVSPGEKMDFRLSQSAGPLCAKCGTTNDVGTPVRARFRVTFALLALGCHAIA